MTSTLPAEPGRIGQALSGNVAGAEAGSLGSADIYRQI